MPSFGRLFSNVKQEGKTTPKTRQNPSDDIDTSVAGIPRTPNPNAPWRKRSASSHGGPQPCCSKVWSEPAHRQLLYSNKVTPKQSSHAWGGNMEADNAATKGDEYQNRDSSSTRADIKASPASQLANYTRHVTLNVRASRPNCGSRQSNLKTQSPPLHDSQAKSSRAGRSSLRVAESATRMHRCTDSKWTAAIPSHPILIHIQSAQSMSGPVGFWCILYCTYAKASLPFRMGRTRREGCILSYLMIMIETAERPKNTQYLHRLLLWWNRLLLLLFD